MEFVFAILIALGNLKTVYGTTECYDTINDCDVYRRYGYCNETSQYYPYMREYCKHTCEICTTAKESADDTSCEDNAEYASSCVSWLKYCSVDNHFYTFMKNNCQRSCGFCGSSDWQCVSGKTETSRKRRVVGGGEAVANSWPWQVGLLYDGEFHCGGTLISPSWVMTAAHCVEGKEANRFTAIMGEHDLTQRSGIEQERNIQSIVKYPGYSPVSNKDDIALLQLVSPVHVTAYVAPACLPEKSDLEFDPTTRSCFLTGWGMQSHPGENAEQLQEVELPAVTNAKCAVINAKVGSGVTLSKGQLCAGTVSDFSRLETACRGDSGGPLACRWGNAWTVEGVVSEGDPTCYAVDRYSVFTRVSVYRDWIRQNTGV